MAQNGNGTSGAVNLDDRVVIVSSDCHIGPRVKEDLAQYCPKKYQEDFNDFVKWMESKESGIGGIDALDLTTGHYDVHARLRDLDKDGTACEVIFHGSQNGQPIPWNVSDPSLGPMSIVRQYDVDYELAAVRPRDDNGNVVRKAGIMGIVLAGGDVRPGDAIDVELPPLPHRPLEPV